MPCRCACMPRASSTGCASTMSTASSDPAAYCRTLRARLRPGAYLVVEKILLAGETLPADWGCDGTTGYDFMDEVNALQHDPAGERVLAEAWSALSGRPADFAAEEEPARREILARSFGAQLDACAAAFAGGELAPAAAAPRAGRAAGAFPVYRTYGGNGVLSAADRAVLDRAAAGARRTCLATDRWAIDPLLRRFAEPDRGRAVARFQQLSAPIAAKAVEDTGFYRYGRLLSRNDVGFDPATFALDADAFHRRMQRRRADWPRALLATATHDHKRGEDVRARLAVLSGMAAEWAALQRDWVEACRPLRRDGRRSGRRRRRPAAADDRRRLALRSRRRRPPRAAAPSPSGWSPWQQKALREAKLASDWAAIDEAYEAAARDFTTGAGGRRSAARPAAADRGPGAAHRARRRAQRPGAVPVAPDRAGRARSLPGHRALGPEPGRSSTTAGRSTGRGRVAGRPAGPLRELAADLA